MNDIVEKLRAVEVLFTDDGGQRWGWVPEALTRDAANEIERLRKRIAELERVDEANEPWGGAALNIQQPTGE